MTTSAPDDEELATTPRSRAKIVRGRENRGEVRCMSGKRSAGGWTAVVGTVGLALLLSACGSGAADESTSDPLPSPTSSQSEPSDPGPSEVDPNVPRSDDETRVLAAFEGFWAANVEAQSGNPDPELFAGNAVGPIVEEEIAHARLLDQHGFVREGAPGFSDISVEIDGDSALVSSCIDYTTWVVPEAQGDPPGVHPVGVVVERVDEVWLVTETTKARPDLTC